MTHDDPPIDRFRLLKWRHPTGDTVAYRQANPPRSSSRPDVLLLHGIANSSLSWTPVLAELEGRLGACAVDIPGHGGSTTRHARITPAGLAHRLADFVDAEMSAPVLVVGHSLGAVVALEFAARHGHLVRGCFLLSGPPCDVLDVLSSPFDRRHSRRSQRIALGMGLSGAPLLPRLVVQRRTRTVNGQMALLAGQVADAEALSEGQRRAALDDLGSGRILATLVGALFRDFRSDFGAVQCPCRCMVGERDTIVSRAELESFFEEIDLQCPVLELPNVGHLPMIERPQVIANEIVSFCSGLTAS